MGEKPRVGDIVALRDTTLTVADAAADVRGRKVVDTNGDEIGEVHDLLVDDEELEVRFLDVGAGGFLGIGEHRFLVPANAVTRVEPDRVHVCRDRDQLRDVPTYDPELTEDTDYYANLYGWWGLAPYWGAGDYAYPPADGIVPPPHASPRR